MLQTSQFTPLKETKWQQNLFTNMGNSVYLNFYSVFHHLHKIPQLLHLHTRVQHIVFWLLFVQDFLHPNLQTCMPFWPKIGIKSSYLKHVLILRFIQRTLSLDETALHCTLNLHNDGVLYIHVVQDAFDLVIQHIYQ